MGCTDLPLLAVLVVFALLGIFAYAPGSIGSWHLLLPHLRTGTTGAAVGLVVGLAVAIADSVVAPNFSETVVPALLGIGTVCGLVTAFAARSLRKRFVRMEPLPKRRCKLALLAFAFALLLCRVVIPCRTTGNWDGKYISAHLCDDHAFLHIDHLRAVLYHEASIPEDWGSLSTKGWNTYDLKIPGNHQPVRLHFGWLLMRAVVPGSKVSYWAVRDLQWLDCRRVIREAEALPRRRLQKDLEQKLIGVWKSHDFASTFTDFQAATNLVFRIYNVSPWAMNTNTGDFKAELLAAMSVNRRDGTKEEIYPPLPHLIGRSTLVASEMGGDLHRFDYSLTNGFLNLSMTNGEWVLRATLQRTDRDAGVLGDGPAWLRTWRGLNKKFVGVWEAREFHSNWEEFAGATNVALRVYVVSLSETNGITATNWADMSAELIIKKADGTERMAADSLPVRLYSDRIFFGFPDAFSLNYSFHDGLLVLEAASAQTSFRAKMKKVQIDPGKPTFLLP
jgi:hypothetical protein